MPFDRSPDKEDAVTIKARQDSLGSCLFCNPLEEPPDTPLSYETAMDLSLTRRANGQLEIRAIVVVNGAPEVRTIIVPPGVHRYDGRFALL